MWYSSDEGIPQLGSGEILVEKTRTKRADLAEEIYLYAIKLGRPIPNSDFKTTASKLRRKVAKELLLSLLGPSQNPKSEKLSTVPAERDTGK